MSGLFIDVQVDPSIQDDPAMAQALEDACPVDIFTNAEGHVTVVEDNLDECVLCELCTKVAPAGKLKVLKLYDGTALVS
jgi:NAD-dependent dihydropyrimidine dehydrogenase PreA subunit